MQVNLSQGQSCKKQKLLVSFLVFGLVSVNALANSLDTIVPDPLQRFDADSKLTVDYRDLDSLLDAVALNTGRSDRKRPILSARRRAPTRKKGESCDRQ